MYLRYCTVQVAKEGCGTKDLRVAIVRPCLKNSLPLGLAHRPCKGGDSSVPQCGVGPQCPAEIVPALPEPRQVQQDEVWSLCTSDAQRIHTIPRQQHDNAILASQR